MSDVKDGQNGQKKTPTKKPVTRNSKSSSPYEEERAGEQTARLRIIASEDMIRPKKESKRTILKERKPLKASSAYRKKYMILFAVVFIVFVIAYQFVKVKDVDFKKLDAELSNALDMEDFQKGSELTLRKLYGISKGEYVEFLSFAPKSNMLANEILVIECKPGTVDSVMARIQSRVDSQSNSFKNYAPDQYKIIANSQLKKRGDYVYFISLKDPSGVNNSIKNSYK